jgi:hypothetical protein
MSSLILAGVGLTPWLAVLVAFVFTGNRVWARRIEGSACLGYAIWVIGTLMAGHYLLAGIYAVLGVVVCQYWFRRKARKVKRLALRLSKENRLQFARLTSNPAV